ncbi:MAG: RIP metalloprotease RseP [Alphaproteobacteria bacterium]|nr:RIP metalloprotease RseP [Alphaproteobacteria bacterium]
MTVLPALILTDVARNIVAGLVMIGVLVVIHEFGHFLFAKIFGIGVPVFSVGMGPRLFGYRYNGTDYRVSALPVGGYVQMAGADPFGEEDASARVDPDIDFMKKPVWQRLIVMLAGPAFNLALPFIVFTIVMMSGEPQTAPVIGLVLEGSPAEQLGFEIGDRIVEADGEPVEVFGDVVQVMEAHPERDLPLVVERSGQRVPIVIPGGTVGFSFDGYVDLETVGIQASSRSSRVGVDDPTSPAWSAGMKIGDLVTHVDGTEVNTWPELMAALTPDRPHEVAYLRVVDEAPAPAEMKATLRPNPAYMPRDDDFWQNDWGLVPVMVYVGSVIQERQVSAGTGCMPGETRPTAAAEAGILPLDRLYRIEGEQVRSWSDLMDLIGASMKGRTEAQGPGPLDIEIIRDGKRMTMSMTPNLTREVVRGEVRFRPIIGVERHPTAYVDGPRVQKYYSFFEAVPRAVEQGAEVFRLTIGVLGKLITLDLQPQEALGGPVEIFRAAGQGAEAGFHGFARLLGTISFSLGIVNLLPVPVLDGGQIVFYSIEGIRGRPLSLEVREKVQMVGILALAALMLMVTVMDVNRWLSG